MVCGEQLQSIASTDQLDEHRNTAVHQRKFKKYIEKMDKSKDPEHGYMLNTYNDVYGDETSCKQIRTPLTTKKSNDDECIILKTTESSKEAICLDQLAPKNDNQNSQPIVIEIDTEMATSCEATESVSSSMLW